MTTTATTRRQNTLKDAKRFRAAAAKKGEAQVEASRRARCAAIVAKIQRILTPDVMEDATNDPVWDVLAATFALKGEDWRVQYDAKHLSERLAPILAAHITEYRNARASHIRVLNLLHRLAWIADTQHAPDSWPRRDGEDA